MWRHDIPPAGRREFRILMSTLYVPCIMHAQLAAAWQCVAMLPPPVRRGIWWRRAPSAITAPLCECTWKMDLQQICSSAARVNSTHVEAAELRLPVSLCFDIKAAGLHPTFPPPGPVNSTSPTSSHQLCPPKKCAEMEYLLTAGGCWDHLRWRAMHSPNCTGWHSWISWWSRLNKRAKWIMGGSLLYFW